MVPAIALTLGLPNLLLYLAIFMVLMADIVGGTGIHENLVPENLDLVNLDLEDLGLENSDPENSDP